jgi:hypothetical protein
LGDGKVEGIDDWALVGEELGFADGLRDGEAEGFDDLALDGCGLG